MKCEEITRSIEYSEANFKLKMTNGNNMIAVKEQIAAENIIIHNDNNMADKLNGKQTKVKQKKPPQNVLRNINLDLRQVPMQF